NAPGFDRESFEAVHASGQQVTSIRINPSKCKITELPFNTSPIPWTSSGYYLDQRPSFTLDPLLHAGCYYVQEASSMFLEQALKQTVDISQPLKVLDLCAAPGGKSTLLQSLITTDSLLVSNEVIKSRSNILQENITKWGAANVVVTNNDPKDLSRLTDFFDVMVIDAPCSGSGLFRRDPGAIEEWSEANVLLCSQRQKRIVADALPALKRDGVLIYCTCSYSVEEDEAVVDWLCEEFGLSSLPLDVDGSWNIVPSFTARHKAACYRFYPGKVYGEGFFIACLQKNDGGEPSHSFKQKVPKLSKPELHAVSGWIDPRASMHLFRHKEDVIAVPQSFEPYIPLLQNKLYLRQAGITLGKLVNNALIPDHALALSTVYDNSLPTISLDIVQALQYLRRADVSLSTALKGWALMQYEGHNLGWAKLLPNRLNNYYPKEWRILKS
ncbi:MAG TPA: RNA methyltransferase, partial [Chitinophagaceae bacterium]|nr:RNA methyltransferase [Chitinophagaceae bacterium]